MNEYQTFLNREQKLSDKTKEWVKQFTSLTFRSEGQTQFLLYLCGFSKRKLINLEIALKDNLISYCPDDLEEVNQILKLKPKKHWFKTLDNL